MAVLWAIRNAPLPRATWPGNVVMLTPPPTAVAAWPPGAALEKSASNVQYSTSPAGDAGGQRDGQEHNNAAWTSNASHGVMLSSRVGRVKRVPPSIMEHRRADQVVMALASATVVSGHRHADVRGPASDWPTLLLHALRRRSASSVRPPARRTQTLGSGTEPSPSPSPQWAARIAASLSLTAPSLLKSPCPQPIPRPTAASARPGSRRPCRPRLRRRWRRPDPGNTNSKTRLNAIVGDGDASSVGRDGEIRPGGAVADVVDHHAHVAGGRVQPKQLAAAEDQAGRRSPGRSRGCWGCRSPRT